MSFFKKFIAAFLASFFIFSMCSCSSLLKREEPPTLPPTVRITFPEGYTVTQTADLLSKNGVCTADEFIAAVNNAGRENEFVSSISNPDERPFLLEGYIFPDTYDFYVGEGAQKALSRFLGNTATKLTDEMYARADELGYTMDEIINIASIIQEESFTTESMKNVSSVLHNRLKSNSFPKLQCDVSIFYLNLYVDPYVSEESKGKFDAFYNTYECNGLPAGPITNPGMEAINAALYPADTDYYFFLTDKNQNYYYAETFSQHLENRKIAGV